MVPYGQFPGTALPVHSEVAKHTGGESEEEILDSQNRQGRTAAALYVYSVTVKIDKGVL